MAHLPSSATAKHRAQCCGIALLAGAVGSVVHLPVLHVRIGAESDPPRLVLGAPREYGAYNVAVKRIVDYFIRPDRVWLIPHSLASSAVARRRR